MATNMAPSLPDYSTTNHPPNSTPSFLPQQSFTLHALFAAQSASVEQAGVSSQRSSAKQVGELLI